MNEKELSLAIRLSVILSDYLDDESIYTIYKQKSIDMLDSKSGQMKEVITTRELGSGQVNGILKAAFEYLNQREHIRIGSIQVGDELRIELLSSDDDCGRCFIIKDKNSKTFTLELNKSIN